MDYVIQELAHMTSNQPYLVILGQQDSESEAVCDLAKEMLGETNFMIKTVASDRIPKFLLAADVFVLASTVEGFPRVVGEAGIAGLPCIVHDYELMHYILGEDGFYCNMTEPGALAACLENLFQNYPSTATLAASASRLKNRFGWQNLSQKYFDMFRECVSLPRAQ
jgi:1,2-diacylglycerol 3-alpha-glucosyltransferase